MNNNVSKSKCSIIHLAYKTCIFLEQANTLRLCFEELKLSKNERKSITKEVKVSSLNIRIQSRKIFTKFFPVKTKYFSSYSEELKFNWSRSIISRILLRQKAKPYLRQITVMNVLVCFSVTNKVLFILTKNNLE